MRQETCPRCGSEHFVKAGFIGTKQRFKCKECNRLFLESNEQSYPPEVRQKALQLVVEGLGFRSIERILGVSHVSVMNWVRQAGLQALAELKSAPAQAEVIELDELHTYIQKKSKNAGCGLLLTVSPLKSLASNSAVVVSQRL
jgi:transposase-like protein